MKTQLEPIFRQLVDNDAGRRLARPGLDGYTDVEPRLLHKS